MLNNIQSRSASTPAPLLTSSPAGRAALRGRRSFGRSVTRTSLGTRPSGENQNEHDHTQVPHWHMLCRGHDRPQRYCGKRRGHHQRQGRNPFRNAGGSASNSAGQPRRNITWTVGGFSSYDVRVGTCCRFRVRYSAGGQHQRRQQHRLRNASSCSGNGAHKPGLVVSGSAGGLH